ncbi:MAG: NADH-quinone oxidoreductase subunit H [Opitutales bacterium]|nr:NADH-quinone oxidoreductase subunit H [Opitutales bacterium]
MNEFSLALIECYNGWGWGQLPTDPESVAVTSAILKAIIAVGIVLATMGGCLYAVLLERKVAAWCQGRVGPCRTTFPMLMWFPVVGRILTYCGFIQPLADGGKLFLREEPIPGHVTKWLYHLAPCLALAPALVTLVMMPFTSYIDPETGKETAMMLCNMNPGFVFVVAVSSLGAYGTILAGWSSNSKYPFLASMRIGAQVISYELCIVTSILPIVLLTAANTDANPLSFFSIVSQQSDWWNIMLVPVSAIIYFSAMLAEMGRLPFDVPESETDTVGGFHTEYGTFKFGLFFVGEYLHIILGSIIFTLFFLGGWHILPFLPQIDGVWGSVLGLCCLLFKAFCLMFLIVWIRWTLPRFRFDQVMHLCWKALLPIAIVNLLAYFVIVTFIDLA